MPIFAVKLDKIKTPEIKNIIAKIVHFFLIILIKVSYLYSLIQSKILDKIKYFREI